MPRKKVTKTVKKSKTVNTLYERSVASKKDLDIAFDSRLNSLKSKISKQRAFATLLIVLLAAFLFYFKSLFIAAIVNGQPISRVAVIRELEKESGKAALEQLITKTLILQEAQKENVSVNKNEIDEEFKKIQDSLSKQGQNLDQVLSARGLTRDDLAEQIKLEKLVEKMVGKDIKVTDQEVNDYIEQNKELFPDNASSEQNRTKAKEQIKQRKLSDKVQTWLTDLQQKAKINYFVSY